MHYPRLRLYTTKSNYLNLIGRVTTKGNYVATTEQMIADYTQSPHAILTSMGRAAIYEGLKALPNKGEIIISPITVPEVISMVLLAGFTPVFCDVEKGTWNMDVNLIPELITDKTTAIMTTHYYGNTNTVRAVRKLCDTHNLIMIEDAAQAIGVWNDNQHAGTIGDFGIFSFSYPKNVTSFYGGCIVTNSKEHADLIRQSISNYPVVNKKWLYSKAIECIIKDIATMPVIFEIAFRIIQYGYRNNVKCIINSVSQALNDTLLTEMPIRYLTRMSSSQAKMISKKWSDVDKDVQHRIDCARAYYNILHDVPNISIGAFNDDRSHGYLYYPIEVDDKYALQQHMINNGCDVATQYCANAADLNSNKDYYRDCPNARTAYKGTLMLPTYPSFPVKKAAQYAEIIRNYCLL